MFGGPLLDDLICPQQQRRRDREAKGLGRFEIDDQFELRWLLDGKPETFDDRCWSASREPQRSMTSRGYDPRQSPGLGYKRVVSCEDSFHGTDVLAVSEHGAPGRRPNIHAHFVGRQREDGLDTLPARAAEANLSTLIADIPFPAPGNVAAKRCASEKRAF